MLRGGEGGGIEMRWRRWLALVLVALAAGAFLLVRAARHGDPGPVQRGYMVADAKGCFACHGPGGGGFLGQGVPNPGHEFGDIPPWPAEISRQLAGSDAEIREWVLDGSTRRVRDDPELRKIRAAARVPMPAYRGRISEAELADVVAYIRAVADLAPPRDGSAGRGRETAARYGCFGCHGAQGRGAPPNPGSFKGYIPSWDGADFSALARDDGEVREWILDGAAQRLLTHPLAGRFIRGQQIQMPKYRGVLSEAEVDDVIAYIRWLQHNRP